MKTTLYIKLLIPFIVIYFLSACSSPIITEQECKKTSWKKTGLADSSQGEYPRNLAKYAKICNDYQVTVDYNDYAAGYNNGLTILGKSDGKAGNLARDLSKYIQLGQQYKITIDSNTYTIGYNNGIALYCTPGHGNAIGLKGDSYPQSCIDPKFANMQKSWQSGIDSYCNEQRGILTGQKGYRANINCHSDKHQAYFTGWDKGVRYYCVPKKGYQVGRSGKQVNITCPADLAVDFDAAYNKGQKIYQHEQELKTKISSLDNDIKYHRKEISSIDYQIKNIDLEVIELKKDMTTNECYTKRYDKNCVKILSEMKLKITLKQRERDYLEKQRDEYRYKISELKSEQVMFESEARALKVRELYS